VLERDHGYRVPRQLAIELSQAVQAVTDARGEELSAQDVGALFERQYFEVSGPYSLVSAGVERRREGKDCAVVAQLLVQGKPQEVRGIGQGPVEAFVAALGTLGGPSFELTDYAEHAATSGAGAEAVAYVAVRSGQVQRYGAGRHQDVVLAAFRAVVCAYNRAWADAVPLAKPAAGP
jgi:2-isopropylmalate synthase